MILTFADQSFELHPTGAIFWPKEELLIISDVHLGKITHFRKYGMPIPNDAALENFEKLDIMLEDLQWDIETGLVNQILEKNSQKNS